jgi:hypothetical protein
METVKSDYIHAIGWRPADQTLYIQFKHNGEPGETFSYDNFPYDKWHAFKNAASAGKFFHAHIRGNHVFKNISPGAKSRHV